MRRINTVYILLVALTLLYIGIAISIADLGGTWKVYGFGADSMTLTQVGAHVYGTYNTSQGQGTIDGTINAQNVWKGTWREPFNDDSGYFSAALSNDSTYFYGVWKYAEGDYDTSDAYTPYSGDWDGNFRGEKVVAGNATKCYVC